MTGVFKTDTMPRPSAGRRMGVWIGLVPRTLRALVRGDELWLVALACVAGAAAGLLVVAMNTATQIAHEFLFDLPFGASLSGQTQIDPRRALLVPLLGGLGVGLAGIGIARWVPQRTVDPIEANALHGGKMSLRDSLAVVIQTLLSNSVGASVGLEAGYTQIGAAVASRLGRAFRARRQDVRVLVGCGAAGAIAAAFNAPLTGAFYAFELVIGTYSIAVLAPVVAAALVGVAVKRLLEGDEPGFSVVLPAVIPVNDFLPVIALGVICALVGIAIMRGVTLTETLFRRSGVPGWLRPTFGGLAVGLLALISPAVLSAGHGALREVLPGAFPLALLGMVVVLKVLASAISLGSGFRGGLFFASLFLGALVGKFFSGLMLLAGGAPVFNDAVYGLVGMSAMAVAVVGGPLTMSFLALEETGNLPLTAAVLAAAVVSSITVRRIFGYSFATWRFHLRGEAIRSAVDIGWVRNLSVGRMMRQDVRTVRFDTRLSAFRHDFPLGSANRIVVLDAAERYLGIVWVSDVHGTQEDGVVADLLHYQGVVLLPAMSVKEAVATFEAAEADALAVVNGLDSLTVIGLLTEQFTLRRYTEELDRRRRDLSGE